jgi:hypothetical protein
MEHSFAGMLTGVRTTGACVTVHHSQQRRMDAWSRNTHHKCCFLVPGSLNVSSDVNATLHDTQEMHCNIRNGTMACDRSGSLSSFAWHRPEAPRSEPGASCTAIDAPRERPSAFTTISSCSGLSCAHCAGEARIGRFRHDSPRIICIQENAEHTLN